MCSMHFCHFQKGLFGSVHEIMIASTMYMDVYESGSNVLSLCINDPCIRKFRITGSYVNNLSFFHQQGSTGNDAVAENNFSVGDLNPVHYQHLAIEALDQGLITEGQFAKFLSVNRLEARRIAELLREYSSEMSEEEGNLDLRKNKNDEQEVYAN